MFKMIGLLVLAGAGIMWLRVKASNSSAKNASRKVIDNLKKGKLSFDSLAESLGMLIRSKPLPAAFNAFAFSQQLDKLNNKKLLDKFTVQQVEKNSGNKSIIIAEAVVKDFIPGSDGNREVDVVYPCWIYIHANEAEGKIDFRSFFPQDKEHQYLLEDLSDEIYRQCAG